MTTDQQRLSAIQAEPANGVTMKFTKAELWFISQQLEAASTDGYEGEPEHRRIVDRLIDAHAKMHRRSKK